MTDPDPLPSFPWSSVTQTTPHRRSEDLDSSGLQGASDFIEKEIQEALRREKELKEQRESRVRGQSWSTVYQENKMAAGLFYSPAEKPSSDSPPKALVLAASPQRRPRVKQPDSSVIQSTRVFRHKNQRALRWEAGVFANVENQD